MTVVTETNTRLINKNTQKQDSTTIFKPITSVSVLHPLMRTENTMLDLDRPAALQQVENQPFHSAC